MQKNVFLVIDTLKLLYKAQHVYSKATIYKNVVSMVNSDEAQNYI